MAFAQEVVGCVTVAADLPGVYRIHNWSWKHCARRRISWSRGGTFDDCSEQRWLPVLQAYLYGADVEAAGRQGGVGLVIEVARAQRLFVGRRDCTKLAESVVKQAGLVKAALEDDDVAVFAGLCFVGAEWSLFAKPFQLGSAWVGWPKAMTKWGSPGGETLQKRHRGDGAPCGRCLPLCMTLMTTSA